MILQVHFWVCTQKNRKQGLERTLRTHVRSSVTHGSQKVEARVHQQVNGYAKGGRCLQ